ncbi:MAG: 30S ribosomal protein S12 methylthiotransferase RimO [Atopobiaceae bacterium]|nr:30S ribosomal protein S12 methylthiotransferase RimO [Atopobiaceae bacterium]
MSTIANTSPSSSQTKAQIFYLTLGCAKNEVDTDRMRSLLQKADFVDAHSVEEADLVLINTCSFLESATSESIEATLDIAEQVESGVSLKPIVMCGCVPSRYSGDLEQELPEVAAFVPVEQEDGIVGVVEGLLNLNDNTDQPMCGPYRTIEGASAYVKISDGCNRNCTFCAIPNIRGRYYSRTYEEIASEVQLLVEGGVREIVLVGQDTGVWGRDLKPRRSLAWLVRSLAEIVRPYDVWLRILYLQPEGMTDELIDAFREVDELVPYIDIPIQHCSERILKLMGRRGNPQELAQLFSRLRDEIPGMVLRTTAMAGFPSETEEEFRELCEFVRKQSFDYCSVFAYSAEDGTKAALLDAQIDEQTKLERTQELLDIAEQSGFAATAAHVGELVDVIIDGVEESSEGLELVGHTWFQAPDSDGALHIEQGEAAVGDKLRCRVVDAFCYELVGIVTD